VDGYARALAPAALLLVAAMRIGVPRLLLMLLARLAMPALLRIALMLAALMLLAAMLGIALVLRLLVVLRVGHGVRSLESPNGEHGSARTVPVPPAGVSQGTFGPQPQTCL
jgi:hypothetical protein